MKVIKQILNWIIDKFFLFKLILIDYFLLKNFFINIVVIIFIFLSISYSITILTGPLIASLLTFNLINAYYFYTKYKQWEQNSSLAIYDLNDFMLMFNMYLQGHRFPIEKKKDSKIYEIDTKRDKIFYSLFKIPDTKENTKRLIEIYQIYCDYYNSIKNDELLINSEKLHSISEFLKESKYKIVLNTMYASIIFPENTKYLNELRVLCSKLETVERYYSLNLYEQEPNSFIKDILNILDQIIKLLALRPLEIISN